MITPAYEQKLRRAHEQQRKELIKTQKKESRRRFLIGNIVGNAFPALLRLDIAEDGTEFKHLDAALAFIKAHPEVYQQYDSGN